MLQRVQAALVGGRSTDPVVEIERTKAHIREIYEIVRVIVCMLCQNVVACTIASELGENKRCCAGTERYLRQQISGKISQKDRDGTYCATSSRAT